MSFGTSVLVQLGRAIGSLISSSEERAVPRGLQSSAWPVMATSAVIISTSGWMVLGWTFLLVLFVYCWPYDGLEPTCLFAASSTFVCKRILTALATFDRRCYEILDIRVQLISDVLSAMSMVGTFIWEANRRRRWSRSCCRAAVLAAASVVIAVVAYVGEDHRNQSAPARYL